MPDVTQDALDKLQDAEFVTEFTEGSNSAKRLTPKEMLELKRLEDKLASDSNRAQNGIFKIIR